MVYIYTKKAKIIEEDGGSGRRKDVPRLMKISNIKNVKFNFPAFGNIYEE